jgi:hypothetical protein
MVPVQYFSSSALHAVRSAAVSYCASAAVENPDTMATTAKLSFDM